MVSRRGLAEGRFCKEFLQKPGQNLSANLKKIVFTIYSYGLECKNYEKDCFNYLFIWFQQEALQNSTNSKDMKTKVTIDHRREADEKQCKMNNMATLKK